jgi:Uma2 family endonuclease
MNAPFRLATAPEWVPIRADQFWLLKQEGAFSGYSKSELLEGELWGVPRQDEEEPESDAVVPIKLRVENYERLDQSGAFDAIGKTELVDGLVYRMSPQFRPHGFAKDELAYRLRRCLELLGSSLHVATEQSVNLAPHSEPQPDIVLTREPQGAGAIPGSSVALIVEVSATTLAFDLGEKTRVYAEAGIAEYWVVDVKGGVIHQHSVPGASGYREKTDMPLGRCVEAMTIAGLAVETTGL